MKNKKQSFYGEKTRDAKNLFNNILLVVFYVFVFLIFIGGIIVTIYIASLIISDDCGEQKFQLLVGLSSALFSIIIAISTLVTLTFNLKKANNSRKKSKVECATKILNDFNNDIIDDLSVSIRIICCANDTAKFYPSFRFDLSVQKDALKSANLIADFNTYLGFIKKASFLEFDVQNNILSDDVKKYLNGLTDFKVNTYGTQVVYKLFQEKRVKVLNFFEAVAINILNDLVDNDLLKNQFLQILKNTISLFYYFIYNEEGLGCYPSLKALISKWNLEEKNENM